MHDTSTDSSRVFTDNDTQYLNLIEKSAAGLLVTLSNVIDASRLQSGTLKRVLWYIYDGGVVL